jgi:hypothetical protein
VQSCAQLYFRSHSLEKEFEPGFWAELIADRPPAVNATYYEEIGLICDHLFEPLDKKLRSKVLSKVHLENSNSIDHRY